MSRLSSRSLWRRSSVQATSSRASTRPTASPCLRRSCPRSPDPRLSVGTLRPPSRMPTTSLQTATPPPPAPLGDLRVLLSTETSRQRRTSALPAPNLPESLKSRRVDYREMHLGSHVSAVSSPTPPHVPQGRRPPEELRPASLAPRCTRRMSIGFCAKNLPDEIVASLS